MTTEWSTVALIDAIGQVLADAVGGTTFAAGLTQVVLDAEPDLVPMADDFLEAGLPAVTVALGPWKPILQPGNERYGKENPLQVHCAVWRARVPLGENVNALYGDRDAIANAFIAHSKAFLVVPEVQWAGLGGGPGIVPRTLPAGEASRSFLTLPFVVNVHLNRSVTAQPA